MINDEFPNRSEQRSATAMAGRALVAQFSSMIPGVGGAVGSVAMDMLDRHLSAKELSRVQRTITGAATLIAERLGQGYEPRSDGFGRAAPQSRSFAEEVSEGILIAVKQENEELKLPLYQALIVNYLFNPGLEPASARTMLAIASDLSYRQCCVLAAVERDGRFRMSVHGDGRLRIMRESPRSSFRVAYWGNTLLHEVQDLAARGLVDISQDVPILISMQSLGKLFADAIELRSIDETELATLKRLATEEWV